MSTATEKAKSSPPTNSSSATDLSNPDNDAKSLTTPKPVWRKIYDVVFWCPPNCRWDPNKPPEFSMFLNVLFAFAGAFTVANLYYSHPILNILAEEFGVSYERSSLVPTLMQAGYATGLLFLCPLGDLLPRRPFTLSLVFFTATLWIVLCVTKSFSVFIAVSYITSITTVTPQIMLPLVGDLAPPHRRATALSIVVCGFMFGILIARVLSGTLTNYTSWRTIYWLALGLQYVIFGLLWLFIPDYPSTNPGGINYFRLIWSILVMLTKHPLLVQTCLIAIFVAATFTNFWTTLTFLLAGDPYYYSSLVIGLFGLIGIAAMFFGPVYAKNVTDKFHPLLSAIVGIAAALIGIVIGTYSGKYSAAGPGIQAFLNDWGLQTTQIANRAGIYSLEPKARNRLNTAFMVATFCGQLMGTAVGNRTYAEGGWIASGSVSVGLCCAALLMCVVRGPHETGWVGWRGGWSLRKEKPPIADTTAPANADPEKGMANTEKAVEEMAGEDDLGSSKENKDAKGDEIEIATKTG
ncbi:putative major facilitator superfamily transporter [Aulographum hederae CBS 113979]|uniref:Putative major facilitator superfamily transporter n=1 Tax=Aulographum hederae CBS 113979 TaxID=1176131 RepID=A0A6G1GN56_9PEZI|nr:putative major facilitator superfamily transporter [Aulographum hederae CBS 113979]